MDVILLERIEKLGSIGDVVKVKNGYARNFLLPRRRRCAPTNPTARSSKPIARRSRQTMPSAAPPPRRRRRRSTAGSS